MDQSWVYAQQSVLGACLIDDSVVGRTVFGLGEGDFQDINKTIYRAMRDLYTSGKTVDPVTVLNAIGGEPDYRRYIAELMEITPTSANIDSYIGICRERSRVARYRALGEQLTEVTASKDGAELIANANNICVSNTIPCWSLKEALKNFFERYKKKVEYIPWFLEQLGSQITFEPGDFCLLGGRPSSGKSAFALECALYWAVCRGYRVGFYSYETSREKLTNRVLAASARLPLDRIKRSTLDESQLSGLCDVSGRIADGSLDLLLASGRTVAEVQATALAKRHQIIVVDYLQLIRSEGKDEYSQVSNISKSLHTMCQSLGIFCLALCQLNRTKGARPTLEDLRSSGQLEQDADGVLFLHRQDGKDMERELIIAKNKEGECRSTRLYFDGPIQHFSYMGKGDTPVKGVDYRSVTAKAPGEELDQLSMETAVPFEEGF